MAVIAPAAPRRRLRDQDDRSLAARAREGDDAAFAELYDRHAAGLLAFAQQYVGDRAAAEDVVQQTFMSVYRVLRDGAHIRHPRAWLYRVARNNALTSLRARGPATSEAELADDLHDRAAAVPAQVEQRESLREVVSDFVALPAEQRAALALFELGDLSQAEIATALECSPDRVKALVFQARTSLAGQREARNASCATVRQKLASYHGGALNSRLIRHHLRHCEPCTAYREVLRDRRRKVALILPLLPAPGVREAVLGAFGTGAAKGSAAAGGAVAAARGRWIGRWTHSGKGHWAALGAGATAVVGVTMALWPSGHGGVVRPRPQAALAAPAVSTPRVPTAAVPSRTTPRKPARREARAATPTATPTPTPRRAHVASPTRTAAHTPTPAPLPPPAVRQAPRAGKPAPHAAKPAPRRPLSPPRRAPNRPPAATVTPAPTAAPTPAATPTPAAQPTPCSDHSHASEQGLAHGKGHAKCKTGR